MIDAIEHNWGDGTLVSLFAPSQVGDRAFVEWWGRLQRSAVSPGMAQKLMDMTARTNLRAILPTIQAPTLVLHVSGDRIVPVECGREVAELIPGARFVEHEGEDAYGWIDPPWMLEIEEFLTGRRSAPPIDRVLATVLFTDIVGSTEQLSRLGDEQWHHRLDDHNRVVRASLSRWRGIEIKTNGDGFLATFDGPARAVRCAAEIVDDIASLGMTVRAGVHTGECELQDNDVTRPRGPHRLAGHARGGARGGAGVEHRQGPGDRGRGCGSTTGAHTTLRGVQDPWHLYALAPSDGSN